MNQSVRLKKTGSVLPVIVSYSRGAIVNENNGQQIRDPSGTDSNRFEGSPGSPSSPGHIQALTSSINSSLGSLKKKKR